MKLCLDLFCGGGGASVGYAQAGYHVVGVDINEQPDYPYEFIQADAFEFDLEGFDLIHASPPCQGYSPFVTSRFSPGGKTFGKGEPKLIGLIRELLIETGTPYVIENVPGARWELRDPFMLCGVEFGLPISRHRWFETSTKLTPPAHRMCHGTARRYARERGIDHREMTVAGNGGRTGTSERWAWFLGIEHQMSQHQLREAIPPAYTRWIGRQLWQS